MTKRYNIYVIVNRPSQKYTFIHKEKNSLKCRRLFIDTSDQYFNIQKFKIQLNKTRNTPNFNKTKFSVIFFL